MQGELAFTFSLVYTSTEEVLPQLEALLAVARLDDSKEGTRQAEQRLAAIIQVQLVLPAVQLVCSSAGKDCRDQLVHDAHLASAAGARGK